MERGVFLRQVKGVLWPVGTPGNARRTLGGWIPQWVLRNRVLFESQLLEDTNEIVQREL